MSWHPADEAAARAAAIDGIETVIVPRRRDIGGLEVGRVLPAARRRMVGPFVFFDHMGPTLLRAGHGLDVRPHPHIGLATVTYLLEGELLHRDSVGSVQPIRPGAVNWMTAGRGIVHSERTPPALRQTGSPILGIQSWVALPRAHEEDAPGFVHVERDALPVIAGEGKTVRVIAGTAYGATAPVPVLWPTVYADVALEAAACLMLPPEAEECAVYLLDGVVEIAGESFEAGQMLVLAPGRHPTLGAATSARLMLLGGAPIDGPRHIWWNFVASAPERIERAKADWKAGRFAAVPGETETIPLPE